MGKAIQAYGKAVRAQRLRHLWRDIDLSKQTHLEATAPRRVKGQKLKSARPTTAIAAKRLLVNSFAEAKVALQPSRKSIIANGKAPAPKYTQAELTHIASAGVVDEKYIVRLVEEPHINRGGDMSGTLGASGPAEVRNS